MRLFLLPGGLFLAYRQAKNLILYLATLLNLFISSKAFWWRNFVFPCIVSCHLQTVIVFLLFGFGCLLFLFFVFCD